MRSHFFVIAVGAVVLAACSKPEPVPDPVRAVRTVTVAPESAGGTLEYAAEVRSRTESRLGFRVGGKIVRRSVDLGSTVKAGQVLAQLDPKDLRLGQESATAALVVAQAGLDQAQADHQRFKELLERGFISSAELERRETALKSARAQLDQAKAQVSVQRNQAGYAMLIADASGVITGVDAEPGMVVAAGTPVVRLAHAGPRDVVFSVPEDKVALVKGLAAQPGAFTVRLWGNDTKTLSARVREIAASADPVTRTFLVKADIGGSGAPSLGQTATVFLELPRTTGVTKLPLSALKEEQGRTVVWVVDTESMTVKLRPIQIAGVEGNAVVVGGGVAPGDVVVTAGVHVLNPGQKVKFYVEPSARPASAGVMKSISSVTSK